MLLIYFLSPACERMSGNDSKVYSLLLNLMSVDDLSEVWDQNLKFGMVRTKKRFYLIAHPT